MKGGTSLSQVLRRLMRAGGAGKVEAKFAVVTRRAIGHGDWLAIDWPCFILPFLSSFISPVIPLNGFRALCQISCAHLRRLLKGEEEKK